MHIESCMEELVDIMREKGELSGKDFERLGIRLIADESSKDGLVEYHRHGCILTNYAFLYKGKSR